jgi:uncharacterized membrane protein
VTDGPPGLSPERTSLAWWRTSQTALGAALIFAKFGTHNSPFGWVAVGLAVLIAVLAWLIARRGARSFGDASSGPAILLTVTGLAFALAASVLAYACIS